MNKEECVNAIDGKKTKNANWNVCDRIKLMIERLRYIISLKDNVKHFHVNTFI